MTKPELNLHPYQCLAFASALRLEELGCVANRNYPSFKKYVKAQLGLTPRATMGKLKEAYRVFLETNYDQVLVEKCIKLGHLSSNCSKS
jgi:hypothetical protein